MSRQPSLFRTLVGFLVRMLGALPGRVLALLLIIALIANILTLISPPTYQTLSGLASNIVGENTVHGLLERQKAELRGRAEQAEKGVAALRTQLANLQVENEKPAQDAAHPRVTYQGAENPAQQAVAAALQRMRQRVADASARALSAMPGQALPFLGATVISAATAQNMDDASTLLTDMRDLEAAFVPDAPANTAEVCGTDVLSAGDLWQTVRSDPDRAWQTALKQFDGLPETSLSGTSRWVPGLAPGIFASLDLDEDLNQ